MKWESGSNPELLPGAEYWPDPKKPGEGDLFFQPDRDLKGQKLKVLVLYANETLDAATVAAGRCDPKLRISGIAPAASQRAGRDRPLGRPGWSRRDGHRRCPRPSFGTAADAGDRRGRLDRFGARHMALSRQRWRQARRVSGGTRGRWRSGPGASRGSLDLFFAPYRDEAHATLTLRLIDVEGRMAVTRFDGGACDPGRCIRDLPKPGSRPNPATT